MLRSVSTVTWISVAFIQFASESVNAYYGCTRPYYGYYCYMRCGGNLTATSGTIYSPGYRENNAYINSENCDWYIVPPNDNSSVLIQFRTFATESSYDYLTIYSDPPTYSTSVAEYSGDQLPYNKLLEGPVRLLFRSDGSSVYRGFSLYYTIVEGVAPRFLSFTSDLDVVKGDNVVLPCHVTGIPQPVVTWYKDGLEVHFVLQSKFTLKGNDLIIGDIVEEDFGVFKCKAENYLNSTEQVFELSVNVPPMIITHPTAIHFENIFENRYDRGSFDLYYYYLRSYNRLSAVFRCDVSGSPTPKVYWKKDGVILFNITTKFDWLLITNVNVSDEGNYSCFATNSYGSAESRAASLTIGNVLPCCFSSSLRGYFIRPVATSTRTTIDFEYDGYIVSNLTVTKDGNYYQRSTISRSYGRYIRMYLRYSTNDTGVYGYHLTLSSLSSNSSLQRNLAVSLYVPLLVQVPPRVSVRPSSVILWTDNEHLSIFCSVYSFKSYVTISWFKNNMPVHSESMINGTRLTTAYLRVNYTSDVLSHYTCEAVNAARLRSRSVVTVVFRVEEGGWSWWMESLPCSLTCGFTQGIRYRSRRCYNESIRCPGDNMQRTSCYPSYCPSDRKTIYISPTTMSERSIFTSPMTTSATADYDATTNTSTVAWSQSTVNPSTKRTISEFGTSQAHHSQSSSSGTTAAVSGIVTGIIAAAISAAVTYYCVKRKYREREQTETPLESLHGNASSTCRADSVRYAEARPEKYVKKPTAEASPNVQANKIPSVQYSKNDDQVYQPVGASEHYMHMVHSGSQNVEESEYYTPMTPGRQQGEVNIGAYEEQVYANQ